MNRQKDLLERITDVAVGYAERPQGAEDEVGMLIVDAIEVHPSKWLPIALFNLEDAHRQSHHTKLYQPHHNFTLTMNSAAPATGVDS